MSNWDFCTGIKGLGAKVVIGTSYSQWHFTRDHMGLNWITTFVFPKNPKEKNRNKTKSIKMLQIFEADLLASNVTASKISSIVVGVRSSEWINQKGLNVLCKNPKSTWRMGLYKPYDL